MVVFECLCCKTVHDMMAEAITCCFSPFKEVAGKIERDGKIKEVTLYQCNDCEEKHEEEREAIFCCGEAETILICENCQKIYGSEWWGCCVGEIRCERCSRTHLYQSLDGIAIQVANHCSVCNPIYTLEQREEIEDRFAEATELAGSIVTGKIERREETKKYQIYEW